MKLACLNLFRFVQLKNQYFILVGIQIIRDSFR
jgi:hypothetical protein